MGSTATKIKGKLEKLEGRVTGNKVRETKGKVRETAGKIGSSVKAGVRKVKLKVAAKALRTKPGRKLAAAKLMP